MSLTLRAGALRCELKPELGGCIAGLWLDDLPVLQSTPAAQLHSVRLAASYPLVPFSNRLAHAVLHWNGTAHPLVKNWPPDPHTIHGVGWERPWTVLQESESMALLGYRHRADNAWPFDFETSQAFRLDAQGLEMTMSITNQSDHAAPVGLGWHPFFVKRPGSHVHFATEGRWDMGPDLLPSHRAAHAGLDTDTTALAVDHCFDGWTGPATLRDAQMTVQISSTLQHLVVYTLPSRSDIAIEPVSHANNALNMLGQSPQTDALSSPQAKALGIVVLQPGASFSCEMRIDIAATQT